MESLYLLIPIALVFVVIAIRTLFWAVNSGQYDDLNTEGQRILFEEDQVTTKAPAATPATLPPSPTSAGPDAGNSESGAGHDSAGKSPH